MWKLLFKASIKLNLTKMSKVSQTFFNYKFLNPLFCQQTKTLTRQLSVGGGQSGEGFDFQLLRISSQCIKEQWLISANKKKIYFNILKKKFTVSNFLDYCEKKQTQAKWWFKRVLFISWWDHSASFCNLFFKCCVARWICIAHIIRSLMGLLIKNLFILIIINDAIEKWIFKISDQLAQMIHKRNDDEDSSTNSGLSSLRDFLIDVFFDTNRPF